MTITFFGDASAIGQTTPTAITPPASMLAGDLVYVSCSWGSLASGTLTTFTNTEAGGQSWTALTNNTDANYQMTSRGFWCRFNGTWSGNPAFGHDGDTAQPRILWMVVFRPTVGTNLWGTDVAEANGFLAAAGIGPYTIAGITRAQASSIAIANWHMRNDGVWDTLSGAGWSQAGLSATYKSTAVGNDDSQSFAWSIGTGATGDVSNSLSANGSLEVLTSIIALYEYAAVSTPEISSTTKLEDGQPFVITGNTFEAVKGANGRVLISPSDNPSDLGAVVQTVVDLADWDTTTITIDAADLTGMSDGDTVYVFVKNDSENENSAGFAVSVADMVLRVGPPTIGDDIVDSDTGLAIASESLIAMAVLSTDLTTLHATYIDASITAGRWDYDDPAVANVTTEADEFSVIADAGTTRLYALRAKVVDRNED